MTWVGRREYEERESSAADISIDLGNNALYFPWHKIDLLPKTKASRPACHNFLLLSHDLLGYLPLKMSETLIRPDLAPTAEGRKEYSTLLQDSTTGSESSRAKPLCLLCKPQVRTKSHVVLLTLSHMTRIIKSGQSCAKTQLPFFSQSSKTRTSVKFEQHLGLADGTGGPGMPRVRLAVLALGSSEPTIMLTRVETFPCESLRCKTAPMVFKKNLHSRCMVIIHLFQKAILL